MWEVMFWPIAACVLLPWLLVYLGLHVVQRGIIFIDIAMAQMASLGICAGVLLHLNLEGPAALGIALGFTLIGASIFSFTNKSGGEVPQEAIIGICYAVASAASSREPMRLTSALPHGFCAPASPSSGRGRTAKSASPTCWSSTARGC